MATEMLQYLDPDGLDETVLNIGQIKTSLEGQISDLGESIETELQDLPYARPDGLYPDMTVGAVIGADSTAQWATRVTAGSGAATVRSVQGAAVVQNDELVPVRIAGIASTDAQGGELDAIEWTAQTLRAAGNVRDELTADELVTRVGVVDLGTLTWTRGSRYFKSENLPVAPKAPATQYVVANALCASYTTRGSYYVVSESGQIDKSIAVSLQYLLVADSAYTDAAEFKAAMSGVLLYYELSEPTTQPISPALPMSYKVQQGGTESIIVPDGEVSAAPVLTVAEPVNAGDEFARIWEAIESLGYTRNAAQLSRPVSLTDTVSIDETQKDTTDVVEIDTTKEVQE